MADDVGQARRTDGRQANVLFAVVVCSDLSGRVVLHDTAANV